MCVMWYVCVHVSMCVYVAVCVHMGVVRSQSRSLLIVFKLNLFILSYMCMCFAGMYGYAAHGEHSVLGGYKILSSRWDGCEPYVGAGT